MKIHNMLCLKDFFQIIQTHISLELFIDKYIYFFNMIYYCKTYGLSN